MKRFFFNLPKILLRSVIFMNLILWNFYSYSQCSGVVSAGTLSPVPSSSWQTMSVTAGNYYTFVVPLNCIPTYTFTFCSNGGSASFDTQITILNSSGISESYNDDYCSMQSQVTWTPSSAGTYKILINNYPCGSSGTATLAYSYTLPANMTYVSSTVVQASSSSLTKCDVNQPIICIQVVTGGGACNILSMTQLKIVMSGTSPTTDVSLIHIYYTGTSGTFSPVGAFDGAGTSAASGTIIINGTQTLSTGTNYFWVAYDLNASGTTGNNVDAKCLNTSTLTVDNSSRTVTANDPSGTRLIADCPVSPGSVPSGLTLWLKAGSGVSASGANVTGWTDQSSAATAVTINGSPDKVTSGYNYNPYINFTMSSATGGDYLHTSDINLQSFFWVAKLNDLTRKSTHLATYDAVTLSAPCALCPIHGGENGATVAEYGEYSYGGANFQSAGVWRKNGSSTGVSYNTSHSGNFDIITALGQGSVPTNVFMGGQNSNGTAFDGRLRDWIGPVAEIIAYSGSVSTAQANKIETYLSVKYGITLGGNGSSSTAYTAPGGATLWSANTGYHYDVIGIGKDIVNEGLDQPKSKSINSPSDMITIANSNFSSPISLTNNGDYLIVGHNNGSLITPVTTTFSHGGPATLMGVYSSRIWRSQKTGSPSGNVIIEFNMSLINGPTGLGTNKNADIRLMVDNDVNFSNASAGEHTYTPNSGYSTTGGSIYFTVPYSDIQSGVGYFTIASINISTAPLPIELVNFSANCNDNKVDIKWTTASEFNNDYFTIDRTEDGIYFESKVIINGAGNSSQTTNYFWTDEQPLEVTSYYRLRQTDFDGSVTTFNPVESNCNEENLENILIINTFQAAEEFKLEFNVPVEGIHGIKIMDAIGRVVFSENKFFSSGINFEAIALNRMPAGIYFLSIQNEVTCSNKKVLITK
jgi:trimeric autotransporter adhesin